MTGTVDPATLMTLFEGAPQFLARLTGAGPFDTDEALFATAREIAHAMPEPEQVELIDAHPRLGAPPGSVSAFSPPALTPLPGLRSRRSSPSPATGRWSSTRG